MEREGVGWSGVEKRYDPLFLPVWMIKWGKEEEGKGRVCRVSLWPTFEGNKKWGGRALPKFFSPPQVFGIPNKQGNLSPFLPFNSLTVREQIRQPTRKHQRETEREITHISNIVQFSHYSSCKWRYNPTPSVSRASKFS